VVEHIRVGIVGASPTRGWALGTHIPALRALEGFELVAVATSRKETAAAAARAFGAEHGYDSAEALIADPRVDVVTVSVKVPFHYEIVKAALEAGKHVYCEWPLGRTTAEAVELAQLAGERSATNLVGLQGRMSPIIRYVRDLLAEGVLGAPYFASLSIEGQGQGGRVVPEERAWAADRQAGVTTLSIIGGHNLDLLRFLLGDPVELAASVAVRSPRASLGEGGRVIDVTSPDVVLASGRLASGAFASIAIQAGLPRGFGARLELHGENGVIIIEGGATLHLSDAPLTVSAALGGAELAPLAVPATYRDVPEAVPEGNARNVAGLYLALGRAIAGEAVEPSFATAVSLHRILDAIEAAAARALRPEGVAARDVRAR